MYLHWIEQFDIDIWTFNLQIYREHLFKFQSTISQIYHLTFLKFSIFIKKEQLLTSVMNVTNTVHQIGLKHSLGWTGDGGYMDKWSVGHEHIIYYICMLVYYMDMDMDVDDRRRRNKLGCKDTIYNGFLAWGWLCLLCFCNYINIILIFLLLLLIISFSIRYWTFI